MSKYTPAETTNWAAENLRGGTNVTSVDILADQILRISRDEYGPFVAGIVSHLCVDSAAIISVVKSDHGVEMIANVPKESFWAGSAIKLAKKNNIAFGGYGDLLRATKDEDVRSYLSPETKFVERGLRQHTRIIDFDRTSERLYTITRKSLPELKVVMLNEYELTADHIRTARERYGEFRIIVITNPSGSPTSSALEVANKLGAEVHKWGSFFGRLNSK